jgi:hypothetical protein
MRERDLGENRASPDETEARVLWQVALMQALTGVKNPGSRFVLESAF